MGLISLCIFSTTLFLGVNAQGFKSPWGEVSNDGSLITPWGGVLSNGKVQTAWNIPSGSSSPSPFWKRMWDLYFHQSTKYQDDKEFKNSNAIMTPWGFVLPNGEAGYYSGGSLKHAFIAPSGGGCNQWGCFEEGGGCSMYGCFGKGGSCSALGCVSG